jgi:hypothetical protein
MARALLLHRPVDVIKNKSREKFGEEAHEEIVEPAVDIITNNDHELTFLKSLEINEINSITQNHIKTVSFLRTFLESILLELRLLSHKSKMNDDAELKRLNWKFAATVIDRFCLVLLTLCTLVPTMVIIMSKKVFLQSSDPHPLF